MAVFCYAPLFVSAWCGDGTLTPTQEAAVYFPIFVITFWFAALFIAFSWLLHRTGRPPLTTINKAATFLWRVNAFICLYLPAATVTIIFLIALWPLPEPWLEHVPAWARIGAGIAALGMAETLGFVLVLILLMVLAVVTALYVVLGPWLISRATAHATEWNLDTGEWTMLIGGTTLLLIGTFLGIRVS